ncbi:MAG: hypothetical protein NC412_04785 [Roseburia sp.]|nr:hypothetical protein [Roseburia sp.]MCM1279157.1 hypothetical protein [Robinsoniella sp.]
MIRTLFIGALALICSLLGLIMRNRLSKIGIAMFVLWLLISILDEIRICHTIKTTSDNPQVNQIFDQMFGEEQLMKKTLDEATERIIKGEKKDEK